MALEYAGLVAVFVIIGLLLDNWLGTSPVFVVIFAILAFVAGFLRLFYADRYDQTRRVFRGIAPGEVQREVPEVLSEKDRESEAGSGGEAKPMFDSKTGLTSFKDWNPRRYGDAVPPELAAEPDDQPSGEAAAGGEPSTEDTRESDGDSK